MASATLSVDNRVYRITAIEHVTSEKSETLYAVSYMDKGATRRFPVGSSIKYDSFSLAFERMVNAAAFWVSIKYSND